MSAAANNTAAAWGFYQTFESDESFVRTSAAFAVCISATLLVNWAMLRRVRYRVLRLRCLIASMLTQLRLFRLAYYDDAPVRVPDVTSGFARDDRD